MIVQEVLGNMATYTNRYTGIDWLPIEWYETGKRIFRKNTLGGLEVAAKFLAAPHALQDGDILLATNGILVVVQIVPCNCLTIAPQNNHQLANICYEIGNKHLPLFMDEHLLLTPYDAPLHRLLQAQGYLTSQEHRQLLHPLKTTVAPHNSVATGGSSLFTKIMNLTNAQD